MSDGPLSLIFPTIQQVFGELWVGLFIIAFIFLFVLLAIINVKMLIGFLVVGVVVFLTLTALYINIYWGLGIIILFFGYALYRGLAKLWLEK